MWGHCGDIVEINGSFKEFWVFGLIPSQVLATPRNTIAKQQI